MSGRFATILLDPPWPEQGGGQSKRGADRHYPLVPIGQMFAVIKLSGVFDPARDAHMYMWVTDTYLMAAGRLMADLGFTYKRTFQWVKLQPGVDPDTVTDENLDGAIVAGGLGQYARGQHETILFGTRGDGFAVRTAARDIGSVILGVRGRHSAKPASVHELVEQRSHGPYLEMFARQPREGWTTWGNDAAVMPTAEGFM